MSPPEPRWLDRLVVEAIHVDQVREHGGLLGVRDENVLESALARPRQRWHYDPEADIAELAAAYMYGLCRNHPFQDGNKRVSFLAAVVFVELNGDSFEATDDEVVEQTLTVAGGMSRKPSWRIGSEATPSRRCETRSVRRRPQCALLFRL